MPAGRPTKYSCEMCNTVIECGLEGKTVAEMAVAIGVSRETFNEWRHAKPQFSDAVKLGLLYAQAWWEEKGRVATFGGIEGYNATSYIFQMKNRFRDDWSDRRSLEHTGKDGGPIETADVSPRDKLADFLNAKSSGPIGDDPGE